MSVLIKGMKMPTSCGACEASGTSVCKVWMRSDNLKVRHSDCPLVELPPHGRLIDADALMENAQYKGTHDIVTAWDIVAAPTIIEAEEVSE